MGGVKCKPPFTQLDDVGKMALMIAETTDAIGNVPTGPDGGGLANPRAFQAFRSLRQRKKCPGSPLPSDRSPADTWNTTVGLFINLTVCCEHL